MTGSTNTLRSGVSREEAENIINKFLSNKDYKVLAVKGKWGIGKTHLVRNFLDEHQKNYYLYASVFGISSIEQLKARIVGNYQKNVKPKPINNILEFFNRNSGRLEKIPKLDFGLSGSLLAIGGDLLLEIFFNLNVNNNSIICIDDFEIKSQLPLDEILGFVEYIVQELKCKIILIYSDDNLDQASTEILQTYREKVIDREFTLAPTVEENLDFIFKDHPDKELVKSIFIKTHTNNIRVLRKTRWLIDELLPLIKDWQPSLRNQVLINSIVINLAKFDKDFYKFFSIDIESILSLTNPSIYENNDSFDKNIQLIQKLSNIGYNSLEIDEIIINSIETSISNLLIHLHQRLWNLHTEVKHLNFYMMNLIYILWKMGRLFNVSSKRRYSPS